MKASVLPFAVAEPAPAERLQAGGEKHHQHSPGERLQQQSPERIAIKQMEADVNFEVARVREKEIVRRGGGGDSPSRVFIPAPGSDSDSPSRGGA